MDDVLIWLAVAAVAYFVMKPKAPQLAPSGFGYTSTGQLVQLGAQDENSIVGYAVGPDGFARLLS